MPNPFYRQPQQMNPMMAQIANMMPMFNQFARAFTGDARQVVANMLQSGEMSKAQLEQYSQMALPFRQMMGRR